MSVRIFPWIPIRQTTPTSSSFFSFLFINAANYLLVFEAHPFPATVKNKIHHPSYKDLKDLIRGKTKMTMMTKIKATHILSFDLIHFSVPLYFVLLSRYRPFSPVLPYNSHSPTNDTILFIECNSPDSFLPPSPPPLVYFLVILLHRLLGYRN